MTNVTYSIVPNITFDHPCEEQCVGYHGELDNKNNQKKNFFVFWTRLEYIYNVLYVVRYFNLSVKL